MKDRYRTIRDELNNETFYYDRETRRYVEPEDIEPEEDEELED